VTNTALFTWVITACGGLYLFAVWLIEYDREYQTAAATRLPIPVICLHLLLAAGGLVVWAIYDITDIRTFALASVAALSAVVLLGLTMAVRWIGVRRASASGGGAAAVVMVPPERSFPVSVVIGHGLCAVTTYVLVLLITFRPGGS
jgi:hypothetical protein